MPEHIFTIGSALILALTCISVSIELVVKRKISIVMAGLLLLLIAANAAITVAIQAGLDFVVIQHYLGLASICIGLCGYFILLATQFKPQPKPQWLLYLMLITSSVLTVFDSPNIGFVVAGISVIFIGFKILKHKIHAYHFYTAAILFIGCLVLQLIDEQNKMWWQVSYHLALAGTLYQYYRHYCYTIRL